MRQDINERKAPANKVVKDSRRTTCKHYPAEEKIRIVLEELRHEWQRRRVFASSPISA